MTQITNNQTLASQTHQQDHIFTLICERTVKGPESEASKKQGCV
jgi:hypothetical protein